MGRKREFLSSNPEKNFERIHREKEEEKTKASIAEYGGLL